MLRVIASPISSVHGYTLLIGMGLADNICVFLGGLGYLVGYRRLVAEVIHGLELLAVWGRQYPTEHLLSVDRAESVLM